ncbi:hypothetical protein CPB86DRAFT_626026 [Serendipita vermifera]|nr:hypothetical protein CPB86DRAFT_626026 [Serendipita vermifera]
MTICPPTQLVELVINRPVLGFLPSLPHHLPNLTNLTLANLGLCAPLRRYLEVPLLKRLKIIAIIYISSINDPLEQVPSLIDKPFLENIPELEDLSIGHLIDIDGPLVTSIWLCSALQKLSISTSPLERFIPSFSENIKGEGFLPRLSYIFIMGSWCPEIDMNFTAFREQVRAERPSLEVYGDDDLYTYFDSDSGSDSDTSNSDT